MQPPRGRPVCRRPGTAVVRSCGLLVALALGLTLAPTPAAARMVATLEFGAGASIPLSRYIDAESSRGHNTVENGIHASLNLSLLFDGWQFRYAANFISLGTQDFELPQDTFDRMNLIGEQVNRVFEAQGGQPPLDEPLLPARRDRGDVNDSLVFHSLTFGYRFWLLRGRWQPYIPVEIGAAIVDSDVLSRTLYGFTLASGIGLDVRIWRFLYAGLGVRYNFYLTETDQNIAGLGFLASENIFDSTVAMAHVIAVTAQIQGRY